MSEVKSSLAGYGDDCRGKIDEDMKEQIDTDTKIAVDEGISVDTGG